MYSAANDLKNDAHCGKRSNRELCLICGEFADPVGTVLGRVLCDDCMRTISQINVSDDNYSAIMEKLKALWKPVLAEVLHEKDQG